VSGMVRRAVRKADELGLEGVLGGVGGGDEDGDGDGGATLLMLSPERNHSGSSRWQQYGRNFPEVSEIDVMERGGGYWRRVEKEKEKTSPRGVDRSNSIGNGNSNSNGNKDSNGTTATSAATMDASSSVSPLRIRKRGDSASDTSLIQ